MRTSSPRTPIPRWLLSLITNHPTVQRLGLEKHDLLAEIMLQLLSSRRPPTLNEQRFPDGPMAYNRARWALLDTLRKTVRQLGREHLMDPQSMDQCLPDHRHCPEQQAMNRQLRARIAQRFRRLPKRQRRVAHLRLTKGFTERQIAERLGLSTATSHRSWVAARRELLETFHESPFLRGPKS